MAVLIAGGSGFIGLNLAEAYLSDGAHVVLMDRHPAPAAASVAFDRLPGRWVYAPADVTDAAAVEHVFKHHAIERVLYGAAITSDSGREARSPADVFAVNCLGLVNTIKCAHDHGVERMINISSGSAYGAGAFAAAGATPPLDELSSRPLPDTLYSVSKFASEGICQRLASLLEFDVFSVRLASIFGPWELDTGVRDTLSPPMQAAKCALAGEPALLSRLDRRDWTYSRDVATALIALMRAETHHFDLYNITSARGCSLIDLMQPLAKRFPNFTCRLAGDGEVANVNLHAEQDRLPMSGRRLTNDIGHIVPSDFAAMIEDYADWINEHPDYWRAR